jgi:putative sensory transduction regulator
MSTAQPGAPRLAPADVEGWLDELGLHTTPRVDRERVSAWDLELDGRRRFDVPVTLILDPDLALIVWVHFAPPIGDGFRKSYRMLLRWNDEFPFAKFALGEDGRPVLMTELSIGRIDRDELGLAIARLLAICDQLLEESASWLWIGGRIPDQGERVSRQVGLFARYAEALTELVAP